MLGSRMSNQDEDEVEDELDALEREVTGTEMPYLQRLPEAPNTELPEEDARSSQAEQQKARAQARVRKQAAAQAPEPMPA